MRYGAGMRVRVVDRPHEGHHRTPAYVNHRLPHDQSEHIVLLGAQGHANTDLSGSLYNSIGDKGIDSTGSQDQCHDSQHA